METTLSGIILDDRGLIFVSGAEARPFLQGLVTNDVNLVAPSNAIYAALLTPQGKFLHDFIMVAWKGGLLLDTEASRTEELLRRLTMYRLRAKVDVSNVTDMLKVVALLKEAPPLSTGDNAALIRDPRLAALGYRLYVEDESPDRWLRDNNIAQGDRGQYEHLRLSLGVPDGSRDIPVERAFPLEYGFDALGAVNYDKGCFVGQELTARTHNRGKVKKGLHLLEFEGAAPPPGTPILHDGRQAGEILSGDAAMALAHLRFDATNSENTLVAAGVRVSRVQPAPIQKAP